MVIYLTNYKRNKEEIIIDLEIPTPSKQAFHNDVVGLFNEKVYDGVITSSHIVSKEQLYDFKTQGQLKGFRLETPSSNKVYFLQTKHLKLLPIKIDEEKEDIFRTDVLHIITKCTTKKITANKDISFRTLMDWFCNFEHETDIDFLLYKIMSVVGAVDRINYHVITRKGFGKDSIVDVIAEFINSTSNIYSATFAKLEYSLQNEFIVLNEMGNLKTDDKFLMQTFLLACAAYRNNYIKKSRKTANTQEKYDIRKLSISVLTNPDTYYREKGQETFDEMFQGAVQDRLMKFFFEGQLTHEFSTNFNAENVFNHNKTYFKKIVRTLLWLRENNSKLVAVDWDYTIQVSKNKQRHKRTWEVVCKYISMYATSKEEYKTLVDRLWFCHTKGVDQSIEKEDPFRIDTSDKRKFDEKGKIIKEVKETKQTKLTKPKSI